jgi:hypothetical protein
MSSPPTLPVGTVARIFENAQYSGSSVLLQPYNSGVELPLSTLGWTTSIVSIVLASGYTLEFLSSEGQTPAAATVTASTLSFSLTGFTHLKLVGGSAFTDTPLATIYADADFGGGDVQLMSWNIGVNTPWSILNLGDGPYSAELTTGYSLEFRVNATDDLALFSVNLTNRSFTLSGNATYVRLVPSFRSKITLNLYDEEKFEQHFQIAQKYTATTWTCPTPLIWSDASRQADVFNLLLRIPAVTSTLTSQHLQQGTQIDAKATSTHQLLGQVEVELHSLNSRIVSGETSVTSISQRLDGSILPSTHSHAVVNHSSLTSLGSRLTATVESNLTLLDSRLETLDETREVIRTRLLTQEDGVTSLDAPLDAIESEVMVLHSNLDGLGTTVNLLHARLADAADSFQDLTTRTAHVESTANTVYNRVLASESHTVSLQSRLGESIESPLQTLEGRCDARATDTLGIDGRLDTWETGFAELTTQVHTVASQISVVNAQVDTSASALVSTAQRVQGASESLAVYHGRVETVRSEGVGVTEQLVSTIEPALDAMHSAMLAHDVDRATLTTRLTDRATEIGSVTTRLETGMESAIVPLESRCAVVSSEILDIQSAILAIVDAEGETGWSALFNVTVGMVQNPLRALIHVQGRLAYLESVVEVLAEQQGN